MSCQHRWSISQSLDEDGGVTEKWYCEHCDVYADMREPLTWTAEKPTTTGWYWAKNRSSDSLADMVEVEKRQDGTLLVVTFSEDEDDEGALQWYRSRDPVENCQYNLWAGPIDLPV